MKRHAPDDAIRAALSRDDPAAVELIWDRYADDLLAFLQALLCSRHDAEDALQAVFLRIVHKRQRLARARRLEPYVYRTARNEAISCLRRKRRQRRPATERDRWLECAEAGRSGDDLAERVQTALAALASSQHEVVFLKLYRDKTFREIAGLLGISLNTAASRYRYGIEKLRTLL